MGALGGTTLVMIAAQGMMGVAGVLAARELGPAGRGVVTAVITLPTAIAWFSLLGLGTAASVRIAGGQRHTLATTLGGAVAHCVIVGGLVTLGAVLLIPSILAHLGGDADRLATQATVTIPIIMLAEILMSVNIALGRIGRANRCRMAGPAVLLGGTVLLVLWHLVTPARIVYLTMASALISLVVGGAGLPWRRMALSISGLLADLKFGVKAYMGGTLLAYANVKLDLVLMSVFVSASQVGYYGVANNLMLPVIAFSSAGAVLMTPRVAGMAREHGRAGIDETQLASIRGDGRRYLLIGAIVGVLVAAAAPVAVPLVFGDAFRPVVVLVWVLIPGYLAQIYASVTRAGTVGGRLTWVGNVTEGAGLVVTAALLPILLPRYDALGAAITSTAAYSTSALVALLAMRRIARRAVVKPQPPKPAVTKELEPAA